LGSGKKINDKVVNEDEEEDSNDEDDDISEGVATQKLH